MRLCFQVMVENGYPPSFAYAKAVRSLRSVLDVMDENGIENYLTTRCSRTCEFAVRTRGPQVIDEEAVRRIFRETEKGEFARDWMQEWALDTPQLHRHAAHGGREPHGEDRGRVAQGLREMKGRMSDCASRRGTVTRDIEAIARFSEADPRLGYSRPTFSPSWRRARDYVIGQAEPPAAPPGSTPRATCTRAPAGSREGKGRGCAGPTSTRSHGRQVRRGRGVVVALEVLRAAPTRPWSSSSSRRKREPPSASAWWAAGPGPAPCRPERLRAAAKRAGRGLPVGRRRARRCAERLAAERLRARALPRAHRGTHRAGAGHVELGPAPRRGDGHRRPAAVRLHARGKANHAGATAMKDRRDALAGAAQAIIGALEGMRGQRRKRRAPRCFTVGRLEVRPNAVNVIPGQACLHYRPARPIGERYSLAGDADLRADRRRHRGGARPGLRDLRHRGASGRRARRGPLRPRCARRRKGAASRRRMPSAARCTTRPSSPRSCPPPCSSYPARTASATIRRSTAGRRRGPGRANRRRGGELVSEGALSRAERPRARRVSRKSADHASRAPPGSRTGPGQHRPFADLDALHGALVARCAAAEAQERSR